MSTVPWPDQFDFLNSRCAELARQEERTDVKVGLVLRVSGVAVTMVVAASAGIAAFAPLARWYVLLAVLPLVLSCVPFLICMISLINQDIRPRYVHDQPDREPSVGLTYQSDFFPDFRNLLQHRAGYLEQSVTRKYEVIDLASRWLLRGFGMLIASLVVVLALFLYFHLR